MKSKKKLFGIIIIILIASIFIYYAVEIAIARYKTKSLEQYYLSSEVIKLDSDKLSKRQIEILLKVQDPGFYSHKGVDFKTPGNGLTTITQAITKKMYFENFKPGIAKIKQTLIARYAVHPLITKEDQLKIFINVVWFYKDCVGFEAASKHFYNKKFEELTEDEYISIIAMISSPVSFNIKTNTESNKERVRRIKLLIEGKYKPKGLMDQFYGKLSKEEQKHLAPASYFEE